MELNQKSVTREVQNIWRLNTTLLNNTWIKKEISIEIGKHFELNNNENTTYQNLWDVAKAELWGTFIALNVLLEKKTQNQSVRLPP